MDSKAVILDELYFTLLGYKEDIKNLNRAIALLGKDKYKECYKEVNKNVYLGLFRGASVWMY